MSVVGDSRYPGQAMPSLYTHRWPDGWQAGIRAQDWSRSICASCGKLFGNQAMLSYHPEQDAYCLAFRGTVNFQNVLEDFEAVMVSAQALTLSKEVQKQAEKWIGKAARDLVISSRTYCKETYHGTTERAMVHLGFRVALESLDFAADEILGHRNRLSDMLKAVIEQSGGKPIRIYVTGHSLGAGMATLAAAWLNTQPFAGGRFDVKCYAFAQPKPGNEYFAYQYGLDFANQGAFAVLSSLDTVPQVPLTLESVQALNYPMSMVGLRVPVDVVKVLSKLHGLNYAHAGRQILLHGNAIVDGAKPCPPQDVNCRDDGFYSLPPAGQTATGDNFWRIPAYLMFTPKQAGGDVPDRSMWDSCQYDPEDKGSTQLANLAGLWQHLPWMYQQWLYLDKMGK
ncbi:lipase family protein [Chromobacterium sp. IIBBL 290-4]|uniref:lipase family protein n=1 Tax=Chromobacterium sp. IIBBL 290-4 TaxID=2953890 RepID=UPI0020B75866|nr:lipase family protein [Chromobacterium sp. IIBBL 290-4]UTH72595.1 lipase family protein [Chromobacterium sp. IIBBL 290-4]